MLSRSLRLSILAFSMLPLFISAPAEAGAGFVIVSAAPPLRENMSPPGGYASCYTVPPAFYQGVWINAHRVCEYDSMPGGGMWVSGYWQCERYRHREGVCLGWGWMPGHWANPDIAEYGVRWGGYEHHYGYHNHGHYGYNNNHHDHDYNRGYYSNGSHWN